MMFFKSKFEVYNSIEELPIYNFQKVIETGSYLYMVKNGTFKNKYIKDVVGAWENCYNEYIQHFGLNSLYKSILAQEEKIAKLKLQRWLKDLKHLNAVIKAEETRLSEMLKPNKGKKSFEEDIAIIQKYNGVPLDAKTTSVKMFFTYVKLMEKESNEIKARNGKKDRK
jgi:hypothetical protein